MITAEKMMTNRFLRISLEHTLREALGLILYGEKRNVETSAIVVIDTEGEFAGILTPECLVSGLSGQPEFADCPEDADILISRVEKQFPVTIDQVMHKDVPVVSKDTNLAELIHLMRTGKHECFPVSEAGRVEGLVYVSDVFMEAAKLALTSEHEGIQFE